MIALQRLKSKKVIAELFDKGNFVSADEVFARYMIQKKADETALSTISIAISVPKKKISLAVHRNRVKRLIREACRSVVKDPEYIAFDGSLQIILVFKSTELPTFELLIQAIKTIFSKIGRKLH